MSRVLGVLLRRREPLVLLLTALVVLAVLPRPGSATGPGSGRTTPLQLGVTAFPMWRDWDQHGVLLELARGTGAGWLRVDVGWCSLEERGPGQISDWYQGRLDVTVGAAQRMGMKLLVQLGCAPGWAGGQGYNGYPRDPAQFQRVARYLAQRYRGRVAAWEIWNEPDCIGGCGNGPVQPFVGVLRAGYRGIKSGDPSALVVSGGTSGNDVDWLRRMYAAGGEGYFDALGVHPYQDPADLPPDAPSGGEKYRLTTLPMVHALMVANGDGDKPIWLTEFGWTTADTGPRPGVDAATQARYLTRSITQIRRDYPYVSNAFWFCLRDRDDSTPYENDFGLLYTDGSPKPAYAAFRAVTTDPGTAR